MIAHSVESQCPTLADVLTAVSFHLMTTTKEKDMQPEQVELAMAIAGGLTAFFAVSLVILAWVAIQRNK